MKRFIFLLAGFVFFSTSVWANHSNFRDNLSSNYWNTNQNQSFIFMENGIEFSVFQDGQFDFFIPNQGPNVSAGFSSSHINFSFNTGYNYNPYVQYDNFGAIIQIQNTPIFYDYYGRINQIGHINILYNNAGFVHRIGGLQVFYRNNVVWRQSGFINHINRGYVWRPWHRYYSLPAAQFCVLSPQPYRRFYRPVRHIYYRPYINNHRNFNVNGRYTRTRQSALNTRSQRYAQSPRNSTERTIRSNVQKRHREISRARDARMTRAHRSQTRNEAVTTGRNTRPMTIGRTERADRNVNSRENRTRSASIDHPNRNRISNQAGRTIANQRQMTQNSRSTDRMTGDSKRTQHYRSTPRRSETVSQRDVRRNSVQNKPSSSSRNTSDIDRRQNVKRNSSSSGRSSRRMQ